MLDRSANPPTLPLVSLDRVSCIAADTLILDGISLDFTPGLPTVLLGPNGAGKSTLLRIAMGLLRPTSGSVTERTGAAAGALRKAIVFQRPIMLRRSAAANVAFALTAAGSEPAPAIVGALLKEVGLAAHADRSARRLSGGEQQRLAMARALARAPHILYLDEPTASLDPASTKAFEDIVGNVTRHGVKVVMSTHDLGQARRIAGDVVLLTKGTLAEHTPASRFFRNPESDAARRFLAGQLIL